MQLDIATAAVLFILGAVTWKVVGWSVDRFLKKTAGADYVTREECKACRDHCSGRNDTDLAQLRDEVKQLKRIIIKHLLLNTIPEDTAAREELERLMNA